ncbi:hypothetical protein BV898_13719 [Hypsibius exemplaris]|uniref:Uncharacterized protein n=1 Tax=Hypsibius exemplaris TaxID=2072580 RepID=A0A1W0W9W3_HYPEX|nr:hypothetical protein BV898_13719 [Hypsibius exemplaris]
MARKSNVARVFSGWAVIIAIGLASFLAVRKSVDARRYDAVKTQKTIRAANTPGTYDTSIYRGIEPAILPPKTGV